MYSNWFFILSRIFDKPFYQQWSFWLTLLNLILLFWTIFETIKIRKAAQEQNKINRQPLINLSFNPQNHNWVIQNVSENVACNIILLFKNGGRFKILRDGLIIGVMPKGAEREILFSDLEEKNQEYLNNIPTIKTIFGYLESKKENYSCVVYSDIFGNRMFSVFFASSDTLKYDTFFEAGYIAKSLR